MENENHELTRLALIKQEILEFKNWYSRRMFSSAYSEFVKKWFNFFEDNELEWDTKKMQEIYLEVFPQRRGYYGF